MSKSNNVTSTMLILLPYLLLLQLTAFSATPEAEITSGCPDSCGGIAIQYPFGVGTGCFRKGFEIICDRRMNRPVLAGTTKPVPVNHLSIKTAEARVMLPVAWQCFNSSDSVYAWSDGDVQFNLDEVYRISNTNNQLVVVGCNTLGYTQSQRSEGNDYEYGYYTGCMCYCNNSRSAMDGVCAGVGCCRLDIPQGLTDNRMNFDAYTHKARLGYSPCDYAFLVDRDNYTFHAADLKMDISTMMPVWLDWAIRDNLTCDEAKKAAESYACVSPNSGCRDSSNGLGYVCNCSVGYEGNPYIANGCTDINECERRQEYPCRGVCRNTLGSYECKCPSGSHSTDPFNDACNPNFPLAAKIATGAIGGLFIIAVAVFVSLLVKEKRRMKDYFRKNGGPIIEEVNKIKLFRKKELEQILNTSNCIGQGGFGEVYKGYIRDETQPVAVKKPKIDVKLAGQFANEVIIQSRVLHKNIVKLIGCCLEVDVPILVYEYVPNGSLDRILHDSNRVPLSLDLRLQIAAQSAKGLAYMHSEITTPILHGDVKPANILLDEDFVPKISDFGTSRMITVDEHYASTIIGNWGYMDPEYVLTGLYTSKSDIYSFGVVLLELITRKKALDPDNNILLGNSLDAYTKKKRVIELIDPEIAAIGSTGIFHSLAEIIVQCLNSDVDQRPEMADVAEHLRYLLK